MPHIELVLIASVQIHDLVIQPSFCYSLLEVGQWRKEDIIVTTSKEV